MYYFNQLRKALTDALEELRLPAGNDTLGSPELIEQCRVALMMTEDVIAAGVWTREDIDDYWEGEEQPPLTEAEYKEIGQRIDDHLNNGETVHDVLFWLFPEIIRTREKQNEPAN